MDDKQETRTGEQEREEMQAERVSPVHVGEVGQISTLAEMDIVGEPLESNNPKSVIEPEAAVPASSVVPISNATAGPSSSSTTTAQPIPQDLELIMNMVTNGNDLAALSVADRSTQGQPGVEVEVEVEAGSGSEDGAEEDSDPDSDSDSSSIQIPPSGPTTNTPMSQATRDRLMAQLTTFYTSTSNDDEGLNEDGEGYITADSDELEEEGAVDVGLGYGGDSDGDEEALAPTRLAVPQGATIELMSEDEDDEEDDDDDDDDDQESVSESSSQDEDGKIDLMDMEDESDEEAGAAGPSVPPKTKHELEDDRAVVPQVEMLKDGERLVLAGEIMSVLLIAGVKHEPEVGAEMEVKVEPEVEVEVDVNAAVEAKTDQAKAEEEVKPEIAQSPLDPSTTDQDSKPEPAATAADHKPKPVKKDAKTKQREKRQQKQLAKSSGTIIIKALRPPLGEAGIGGLRIGDDEGWLEEGSLICLENRRVLAVVAETFGPLSQPFYLLRLPPAPYPLPTASELTIGKHVYYPASGNRSFVPVRMLRTDKRYKGTDASNLHDEEVSESEREWSDDEAEREAKRQRKAGKGKAPAAKTRHWDAGAEVDIEDDSEFLDYAQGPETRDEDDGRSMAGMSTVSTRGGRTGPVRYDDIVPSGSADQSQSTGVSGRGARGGAIRGRGRGGPVSDARPRGGERDQQRGRGRGEPRGGARRGGDRGSARGGATRNQDGGRQIGQGSGRGRGRGQGGFGLPVSSHGGAGNGPERSRDMSPTSLAIARATSQAPMLPQGTGIAQPMSAPAMQQQQHQHYGHVNPMMQMQQPQQYQPQQQAMMGMPYGWQGQPGHGMGMPQMPFYFNPMQQGQQGFGGQFQQGGAPQGAFNPAFAARMMGMGMGMPYQQSPQNNNNNGGDNGQNGGQQQ
ncbi:Gar1/Naf1 RNA binding region-domain-containing protein [Filobasidium floriforme]|uniref:Gar1/Naf1 RNA binding region-domain-containing protein n=1 Tax=Filobasidium floriforme TaxID=5210 RepID=UPI001E8EB065|nr:Gar1/Naf1 RNA binding region-domain-containing protein [Filobasidium floriforme]KAH8088253.1 Gar1/Naf1 RNA binding region-domain-containing protein [Filobasidium floriforme]